MWNNKKECTNEEDQKNKIKAELADIDKKMAELQKQKENLNDLLE